MKQTKETSNKPGNSNNMKYLNGQRESYSLSLSSRKRFVKRKLMYVNNKINFSFFYLRNVFFCVVVEELSLSGINFTEKYTQISNFVLCRKNNDELCNSLYRFIVKLKVTRGKIEFILENPKNWDIKMILCVVFKRAPSSSLSRISLLSIFDF